ncbi:MAG TPA: ABC transporter ATP-binding protein [Hyphomicrobium sp.]|nr:ABC transporter ATP-binding protein [Hyphomicrobium sp.]
MTRLAVSHLSVLRDRRSVLTDVSFKLSAGEFVGLIGPNGSGKSTLLRALLGLVASTGEIEVEGVPVSALAHDARARTFSYLPQERDVAWPMPVEDLVGLGRTPYRTLAAGLSEHDRAKVDDAMRDADVEHLRTRIVAALSGGERARVLIARTLAQDTPILLVDEPTAGLDPAHQIALMRVLAARAARGGIVLASLHELALAARWCSRLILISDNGVKADGTPAEVLTEDILRSVYGVSAFVSRTEHGLIVQPLDRV